MSRPDVAWAIVVDGRVTRVVGDGAPVPWWSFTKTVIAAAILALVRDGELDLDAALDGEDFCLADVMAHRAGLPDYGAAPAYARAVAQGDTPWTADAFLALARNWKRGPVGAFAYSNIGYLLLRRRIEAHAGGDLDAALQALVLAPLGINDAKLARLPGDLARCAWGNPQNYHPGWVAHGLLIGPPAAAALLLDRLLSGHFLPPALLQRMCAGLPVPGGPWKGRPWREAAYGLGLMTDRAGPLGFQAGHSGQGLTTAAVYRFTETTPPRTVAVFASTTDIGAPETTAIALARQSV